MPHQPATIAPPDCGSCGADDELIAVSDPGGSVLLCPVCVIALIGSTEARVAVLLFDETASASEPWERGDDRTDASGPDLPDWPTEKEI